MPGFLCLIVVDAHSFDRVSSLIVKIIPLTLVV